jgi:hypothetical protein
MKAYGVEASIEATKSDIIKQADGGIKGVLAQLKSARPNLTPKASAKINAAVDKYLSTIMSSWNAADVVMLYTKIYEDNYSLEEMQALASYVKTDHGIKSIRVAQSAQSAINGFIIERMMSSLQGALRVCSDEIRGIVAEDQKQFEESGPNQTLQRTPDTEPVSSDESDSRRR